ncbi:hypothetical protein BpHYR1_016897 [Brachionus plicatilis]|uniref:Uncharacterized protein n=1 Tax=Brachionus plicatilis TaxID=10195 RepID=A0A3M7RG88_BRAPC|nr:hypothetical protein BpHYR1_016897 [Brachionus plicatilis]
MYPIKKLNIKHLKGKYLSKERLRVFGMVERVGRGTDKQIYYLKNFQYIFLNLTYSISLKIKTKSHFV